MCALPFCISTHQSIGWAACSLLPSLIPLLSKTSVFKPWQCLSTSHTATMCIDSRWQPVDLLHLQYSASQLFNLGPGSCSPPHHKFAWGLEAVVLVNHLHSGKPPSYVWQSPEVSTTQAGKWSSYCKLLSWVHKLIFFSSCVYEVWSRTGEEYIQLLVLGDTGRMPCIAPNLLKVGLGRECATKLTIVDTGTLYVCITSCIS